MFHSFDGKTVMLQDSTLVTLFKVKTKQWKTENQQKKIPVLLFILPEKTREEKQNCLIDARNERLFFFHKSICLFLSSELKC